MARRAIRFILNARMPPRKSLPTLDYERAFWHDGYARVAGLDEAGRGALAGPVVAAAVIFPQSIPFARDLAQVNDSKQLSPATRAELFEPIQRAALAWGVGFATHAEIDALNIARAARLAMLRALAALSIAPDALLLDAFDLPDLDQPQIGLIHGDALSVSIAAASILAKVTRDRYLCDLDAQFPAYQFARHKGYATAAHRALLRTHGPCPVHRASYAPVRRAVDEPPTGLERRASAYNK